MTGAAGATSVTGTFDTAQTGSWACTILHNDGTYGVYTASAIAAGTLTISPPLRAAATAKPLASLGGALAGQHYGLQGYKALARKIFATTKREGYRGKYAAQQLGSAASGWSNLNGGAAITYASVSNAFPSTGAGSYWFARGTRCAIFTTNVVGRGITRSFSPAGRSGYVETFIGQDFGGGLLRCKVVADGVTVYNETFTALTRVVAPFTAATTVVIEITGDSTTLTEPRVGDTTCWVYDRTETWTDPAIDKNKNVVVLGDSWSARYSGGLGLELQAAITAAGGTGTVTTVATGGTTAEFGLARFDADVAPLLAAGDSVVIEYFTNDHNSFGVANSDRWLSALYAIGRKCQALGAHPIFVMPLPTQSQSQSAGHGQWAERIGAGLPG